jgi:hypothetical protein
MMMLHCFILGCCSNYTSRKVGGRRLEKRPNVVARREKESGGVVERHIKVEYPS